MSGMLARILRGYLELGKGVGIFLLLVAGSAALGFAIAWPLWYFATAHRGAYTLVVLALLAAAGIAAVVRAAVRRLRLPPESRRGRHGAILVVLWVILLLGGLYVAALLVAGGAWHAAIPVSLGWLVLLGWIGFARKPNRKHRV